MGTFQDFARAGKVSLEPAWMIHFGIH